jgi:hypothetical protein
LREGSRFQSYPEAPQIAVGALVQRTFLTETHGCFQFWIIHAAAVVKNRDKSSFATFPRKVNANFSSPG